MTGKLAASALLALTLLVGAQAWRQVGDDLRFARLEAELTFWGRDDYQPTEATRERTEQGVLQLLQSAPDHPDYLSLRAGQLAWEAWWAPTEALAAQHARAALAAQRRALDTRPAHGQGWRKVLEYAQRIPDGEPYRAEAGARLAALDVAR